MAPSRLMSIERSCRTMHPDLGAIFFLPADWLQSRQPSQLNHLRRTLRWGHCRCSSEHDCSEHVHGERVRIWHRHLQSSSSTRRCPCSRAWRREYTRDSSSSYNSTWYHSAIRTSPFNRSVRTSNGSSSPCTFHFQHARQDLQRSLRCLRYHILRCDQSRCAHMLLTRCRGMIQNEVRRAACSYIVNYKYVKDLHVSRSTANSSGTVETSVDCRGWRQRRSKIKRRPVTALRRGNSYRALVSLPTSH